MDKLQLTEYIRSNFQGIEIKEGKQYIEVLTVPAQLRDIAKRLKADPELCLDFLFSVSGVDYKTAIEAVYHLHSSKFNHDVVLKTRLDNANPAVETVSDIWKTAEFHEREAFDLLGIKFIDHPDLRRLFLEDPQGYPLRKDFTLDTNVTA